MSACEFTANSWVEIQKIVILVGRKLMFKHHICRHTIESDPKSDEGVERLEDDAGLHHTVVVELPQELDHADPTLVVLGVIDLYGRSKSMKVHDRLYKELFIVQVIISSTTNQTTGLD